MMGPKGVGGNRRNGVEVNQQLDNSIERLDDGHSTLEVGQNSLRKKKYPITDLKTFL